MHCLTEFPIFPSIWQTYNTWSVAISYIEIHTEEPQQFHLHIELNINLDRTMLDKILYVADKSAMPW